MLDAQGTFDPAEEQFDTPPQSVAHRHAQPLAPSQLRKGHAGELLATAEMPDTRLGIVAFHEAVEGLAMHKIECRDRTQRPEFMRQRV